MNIRSDEGYTLLELLVALSLVAIMAVPLTDIGRQGLMSWGRVHSSVERNEQLLMLQQRLRDWLSEAYPFDVGRNAVELYPMDGGNTEVSFTTRLNPDPSDTNLYRVRLHLQNEALQLEYRSDFAVYAEAEEVPRKELLTGVESVEISYMTVSAGAAVWRSSWTGMATLPAAIKVRLHLKEQMTPAGSFIHRDAHRAAEWVEVFAPLKVREWAFCAFDPVSRKCRPGEVPQ